MNSNSFFLTNYGISEPQNRKVVGSNLGASDYLSAYLFWCFVLLRKALQVADVFFKDVFGKFGQMFPFNNLFNSILDPSGI